MSYHIITNKQQLEYLTQCIRFAQVSEDFKPHNIIDELGNDIDDLMLDMLNDTLTHNEDDTIHSFIA